MVNGGNTKVRMPVIIGVGQSVYHGPPAVSSELSPVGFAATAAARACADAGFAPGHAPIDVIAGIRLFADAGMKLPGDIGGTNNFPRAVAARIGVNPARAIYDIVGGQSPQRLTNELCQAIADGTHEMALIVGAEAIGLAKAAQRAQLRLDWREEVAGGLEDRGLGEALLNKAEARHRLFAPVTVYALIEHALRMHRGRTRAQHVEDMAALMAPFSVVAASNPYAQFPRARDAAFLSSVSAENYAMSDPFTKWLVAQDAVNQAAAVLITSVERADEIGVPADRRVYLHGCADADDLPTSERPEMGRSSALVAAAKRALDIAEINSGQVPHFDFYSCFPCAVSAACEAFDVDQNGARVLTVTGGLPFFGGPGNAYSLNAIAAMVNVLRADPGRFGVVSANGGYLSKQSVGVYNTQPPKKSWTARAGNDLTSDIRKRAVDVVLNPEGVGIIETFTVGFEKGMPAGAVIIGRLDGRAQRFIAATRPGDQATVQELLEGEPVGRRVQVNPVDKTNVFAFAA